MKIEEHEVLSSEFLGLETSAASLTSSASPVSTSLFHQKNTGADGCITL